MMTISPFKPYSKLAPITRDISFWINNNDNDQTLISPDSDWPQQNDFYDIYRHTCGDIIESMVRFDAFYHPKKKCLSYAYHITYSPIDTTMNNPAIFEKLVTETHKQLVENLSSQLSITIR